VRSVRFFQILFELVVRTGRTLAASFLSTVFFGFLFQTALFRGWCGWRLVFSVLAVSRLFDLWSLVADGIFGTISLGPAPPRGKIVPLCRWSRWSFFF